MILKIKKWFGNLRVFKRIREAEETIKNYAYNIDQFRAENDQLKDQLMARRKTIKELKDNLIKTTNDLNLLGDKKKKAEIFISQLIKRRNEFLRRIESKTYIDINSMADYKFFLSEPFIKDHYDSYNPNIDDVDRPSIIKGLGKVLDDMDLKKSEEKDESK